MSSPIRSRDLRTLERVRLLRANPDIPYRDGAEERVLEIVRNATDITSSSTEMLEAAESWAEQYHTHPARANVLRSLDIPSDARVLEVGAGCGPITRYLGETAALVDSVEPVLGRARVGRERTRDLDNVEVFAGNVEDIPCEAAYDLVVVVGVLEYVGAGAPDPEPYLAFLREARSRLVPGGALVLAIENKLGVKYLTGTAEDHSRRMYDSIEDYPRGTPARTFSAPALAELVSGAGFTPRLFGVFPDYKHTRVVMETDRIAATVPSLLEDLPTFPSRYAGTRRVPLASERRVWAQLSRAGLSGHFANSFLVVGATDRPPTLWADDRLARYFSVNRRREYAATTSVRVVDDEVLVEREYSAEPGELISHGMTTWPFRFGRSFVEVFAEHDEGGRRELLERWRHLVESLSHDGAVSLDAIPNNIIVAGSGELQIIDEEFHATGSADRVIERGLFWFAKSLLADTPPEMWAPARTMGELFICLMDLVGRQVDEAGVARILDEEAALQVAITTNHTGPDAHERCRETLRTQLFDRDVWDWPLGRRLHNLYDVQLEREKSLRDFIDLKRAEVTAEHAQVVRHRDTIARQRERIVSLRDRSRAQKEVLKRTKRELRALRRSRAYRASAAAGRALRALGLRGRRP
ncbi:class I SAM-dependent methyltransferase [Mumia sp. zg.B53]|uniref:class I SAM-dependent methyltransferase n=1 Tax=Mumia sp. zg.B53 TaxID=2855449 RepID=UPI001C6F42B5|nr:class I SAM-dependent methyltransferase [Mumia sp. zg.B53]MBW9214100.1 class I SAM-dependent methyltransferase [Mumia sp. zg.B53]